MNGFTARPVATEVRGHVLVVTLSRPSKRNAVNGQMTEQMATALDLLEEDDQLRVAVLTGAGGSFCSGADLRAGPAGEKLHDRHGFASITRRQRSKPLIAAVEGAAHAGGFEIVLSCDIVVAAENAHFALPEPKRGVMAGTGLVRLPRHVGFSIAAEIGLTGAPFPAPRAYQVGLISRVTSPGGALGEALEIAAGIVANSPGSVRESLHILRDSYGLSDEEAEDMARTALRRLAQTADFREGPRAFVEHRAPRWTGN
jgi:enoyl-CoA hydratase